MTQEQIEYTQFERLRKQHLNSIYAKSIRIQQIREFIAAGGDPATDPDMKDDYFVLMEESNGRYFQFEDIQGSLTKE